MSLQDSLRKKLTPEKFQEFIDLLGDDFNYDLVPRTRLNAVIRQRDDLKEQLEIGQHPDGESDSKHDEQGQSSESKPAKKDATQEIRAQLEAEKLAAISEVQTRYAVLDKLRSADVGAIDPEFVCNLLDTEIKEGKIKRNDKQEIEGLDEILSGMKESKTFLFREKEADTSSGRKSAAAGTGFQHDTAQEPTGLTGVDAELAKVFAASGVFFGEGDS